MTRPSLWQSLLFALFLATGSFAVSQRWETQAMDEAPPREPSTTRQEVPFDVDAVTRQVHFAYRPEQDGWRGGHSTYDVKATPQGITLTPVHYKTAELADRAPFMARAAATAPPTVEVEAGAPLFLGADADHAGECAPER